ncbi:hypothetical protein ACFVYV_49935 [Streptomyces mirabilis]|nr:hypothetical protein [Streptomyces sp. Ag82_O1-15]
MLPRFSGKRRSSAVHPAPAVQTRRLAKVLQAVRPEDVVQAPESWMARA